VRALYTDHLVKTGQLTTRESEAVVSDFRAQLDRAFEETGALDPAEPPEPTPPPVAPPTAERRTAVEGEELVRVVRAVTSWPPGFHIHPKLERILGAQRAAFERGEVDWTLAEACAFGTLALEGTPVRVAGQDTRRGTFSQRHGVLVDQVDESEHFPLGSIAPDQAPFRLYDTVLSEYAALGFEYGYSIGDPTALVAWEAQFGDFANGAQIVIDQFVVAAEDKWGQSSGLVLLLPHGLEGQGPEHSSARVERFLTLCAGENLRVVQPTTAAQYFHVLRRQVTSPRRTPLVCFTPKRYLRAPETRSPIRDLVEGRFHEVLDDSTPGLDPATVRRVVVASGKVAHELIARRGERRDVAVVRLEQLSPWPEAALRATLDRYSGARELRWLQEEPENMGAWLHVWSALARLAGDRWTLDVNARRASPSPAPGSTRLHGLEQDALLDAALG
jgi:2-oxoglutarate decarboxylase